ncbi:MAG: transferrin-binding protein-like solute binding protein [Sphingomicrobium sp.]
MALYRKHSMTSAIALAISLTACAGGGNDVAFVPMPPPPPIVPPPPIPTPIGAPAMATVPNANLFPFARTGGPTMQAHSATVFPLLETVVLIDSNGLSADTAAIAGGATLAFASPANSTDPYTLSVPGAGYTDVAMVAGGRYCYGTACGSNLELDLPDPATSNLSWMTYGSWAAYGTDKDSLAPFVTGFATPIASVPTTGSATYRGAVQGSAWRPQAGAPFGVGSASLRGDATLQANFGTASVTGSLTNMTADGSPWNSVSLLGSISGGQNYFSGTSAASSAPGGAASLGGSATGTFAGLFFGPNAQELGAVWTLFDGTAAAVGTIGARTGP